MKTTPILSTTPALLPAMAMTMAVAMALSGPVAAQDLPPDILADRLLLEAGAALASGDPQQASRALREIEALEVEPPPIFSYVKGRVLTEYGDGEEAWRKGRLLLARFAVAAGRDSEHYGPALEAIRAVEGRIRAAARRARLGGRLAEVLKEVNAQMVRVEGGTFTMGCTPERQQCGAGEEPARPVHIESFEIGRFEMTQEIWEAVMGENPSAFGDCPRCPVETVSWEDVHAFLGKLNAEGERYRLPSEAEWEYAARGGQPGTGHRSVRHQYAESGHRAEAAWSHENAGHRTQPVGSRPANELGLFDLSGNVREWVRDCRRGSDDGAKGDGRARVEGRVEGDCDVPRNERVVTRTRADRMEDRMEGDCDRRAIRGGSWYGEPGYARPAGRIRYTTGFRGDDLGFRIARTPGE